jgi:putative addiction module component, TIGR02574 family
MSATVIREQIAALPVADQLELIEGVWEDIVSSGNLPNLTPAQTAEIDRRVAWLDANPEKTETWEDVEAFLDNPK